MERQSRVIDDSVIAEYVNRIGQNIVRNSDAKVPFTIKVLDTDEVNAFALPGGFFFVNTGLVLKADSESELAGVMAHEIAHVAARHGTKQATRGEMLNIASIPLIFMGGWAGYAFSTHPMTADWIKAAQAEIQKILVAKPDYVVDTSEFHDVKGRLAMMHSRRSAEDPGRPQLRRAPGSGRGTIDSPAGNQKPDEADRPTLKRRDQ